MLGSQSRQGARLCLPGAAVDFLVVVGWEDGSSWPDFQKQVAPEASRVGNLGHLQQISCHLHERSKEQQCSRSLPQGGGSLCAPLPGSAAQKGTRNISAQPKKLCVCSAASPPWALSLSRPLSRHCLLQWRPFSALCWLKPAVTQTHTGPCDPTQNHTDPPVLLHELTQEKREHIPTQNTCTMSTAGFPAIVQGWTHTIRSLYNIG